MSVKLQFISNNVKGLQKSLKRIKLFEYLKNSNGNRSLNQRQNIECGFTLKCVREMTRTYSHLKNNLGSKGFLFLQQTYSSLADEKKWADELKGPIFFSHGKNNSCGVGIGCIGNNKVDFLDKKN